MLINSRSGDISQDRIDRIEYIFYTLYFSSPEILTMHMTHTGEQGYVLYIPNEFAVEIYDSIMEAGLILNIKFGGSLFY